MTDGPNDEMKQSRLLSRVNNERNEAIDAISDKELTGPIELSK